MVSPYCRIKPARARLGGLGGDIGGSCGYSLLLLVTTVEICSSSALDRHDLFFWGGGGLAHTGLFPWGTLGR